MSAGITADDFDIASITCPKCGRPAKVYELVATGDNFLVCRWPECAVGTMEGFYAYLWKSLTDDERSKVMAARTKGGAR